MSKTTIGYVRVSTSKQLDGNGPDQQRAAIIAWAAANGVEKIEWVIEDESGTKEDREKILQLLERAKSGESFTLVVDRYDRLGRRLLVCENLTQRFGDAGVDVVSTALRLGKDATSVLVRQLMGSVAEFQRTEWLARMRTCRKLAVTRKGRHGGGAAPFGYRCIGDGKLAIVPKDADMVRRVFELADGGMTIRAVARATGLNPMQVKRIIDRRKFYAGRTPLTGAYESGVIPSHQPLIGDCPMHGTQQQQALMDTGS